MTANQIILCNKKTGDIVYEFNNGQEIRYRKEDGSIFKIESSGEISEVSASEMTLDDFDRIKAISNEDYHDTEKHIKRITRQDISLGKLVETESTSSKSAEQEYIDYLDTLKSKPDFRSFEHAIKLFDKCLTKTQKRRFLLYHYWGKSTVKIAVLEGVTQQSVYECIGSAQEKLKKFLNRIKNAL